LISKPFAVSVLIITHLVGIWGLGATMVAEIFKLLIPVQLLLCLSLLLYFEFKQVPQSAVISWPVIAILGWLIELIGVYTTFIFGKYEYGNALGIGLFGIPFLIGINWLLLIVAVYNLNIGYLNQLSIRLQIVIKSLFLTLLDYFIEPVAIKLDFWHWYNQPVPLHNYIGWMITSILLLSIYHISNHKKTTDNPIAATLLGCQLIFFIALSYRL
jgi:putative membrane protein